MYAFKRFTYLLTYISSAIDTSTLQVNAFSIQSQRPSTNNEISICTRKAPSCLLLHMNNSSKESDQDDEEETTPLTNQQEPPPRAESASNVLGTSLQSCCSNVRNTNIGTGFYRNGYCSTGEQDLGRHTVCIEATSSFLQYSQKVGNDLSTPIPQYYFPGLKDGDKWCLCAQRWVQAYQDGMAPKLYLQATHEKTLTYVPLEILRMYALDGEEADEALKSLNEQRSKLNDLWKD